MTGIPVIDNLIGDPVNFSQATENPDGTINVPETGPGTNDTGSIGFQDVLQAPDNYQGIPNVCLLYTSPSPRDRQKSRMPSSA